MNALHRVIVLDTETGGLDPFVHSLLSVGLVDGAGQHRLELFVAEPEMVCTAQSRQINHLDPSWVAEHGLAPAAACEAIEAFLDATAGGRPALIAGHNVAFDIAFLRRLYRLAERPIPDDLVHRTLDTHTLLWALGARGRIPAGVRSSDQAFAHFDLAPPEALRHTALGDALATRDLLEKLLALI